MAPGSIPKPAFCASAGCRCFRASCTRRIGSYIARIWRLFDIKFIRYPPPWTTWLLAIVAYVNFFTHHYLPDIRLRLFAFSVLIFWRTWSVSRPWQRRRHMPVMLGFVLVSLFIWFAENLGTFASAWVYPNQRNGWHLVAIEKIGAWYLLMLLSYVLVALVNRPQAMPSAQADRKDQAPELRLGVQSAPVL